MSKLVPLFGIVLSLGGTAQFGHGATAPSVTFTKDVAPILFKSCVGCHRPNDIAPMSLLTYRDARPWAASIREAVRTRKMPPWHADPNVGEYANDPRLTQAAIDTLAAWAGNGAPEGDPKDLPPAPKFEEGWRLGKPDAVFELPREVSIEPSSTDQYVLLQVPMNFKEEVWMQAAEVMPGNRKIVHHATVELRGPEAVKFFEDLHKDGRKYIYSDGKAAHLQPDAPVVDDGCSVPDGADLFRFPGLESLPRGEFNLVAVYLPGRGPSIRPEGYAVRIPPGSILNFQMHYTRTNTAQKDRTRVGLYFAKHPPKAMVEHKEIWNHMFLIPAGASNHEVTTCYAFPRDANFLSYTAHMHYRGKDMRVEAQYPDGSREVLFSVPHYSFNWQLLYTLNAPKFIRKGTILRVTSHFDNSANNPLNPDPTKAIRWGEPSYEEMMGFWIDYTDAHAPMPGTDARNASR